MAGAMTTYDPWPPLPYADFAPTAHLLHMASQMLGKLKLATPFEPNWANVPLWVTSTGLSTGPVPAATGTATARLDLLRHACDVVTSWGSTASFPLDVGSVAALYRRLRAAMRATGVDLPINPVPQEVDDPVPFDRDDLSIRYDPGLANAWWRILVSSERILHRHRARFWGTTPPPGLMWGTFDLRDVRYHGPALAPRGGYISRNAMNRACVECGFWHGSAKFPQPLFYSFTHPAPPDIEQAAVAGGRWDPALGEYVLDYGSVRTADDPGGTLLRFLEAAYRAGAERSGWPADLLGTGVPDEPPAEGAGT